MHNTIVTVISICVALTACVDLFAQDGENVEQVGRIYNYWADPSEVAVQDN